MNRLFRVVHRAYRAVYRINRATRTAEVVGSGSVSRIEKLAARRVAYGMFARLMNRVLK